MHSVDYYEGGFNATDMISDITEAQWMFALFCSFSVCLKGKSAIFMTHIQKLEDTGGKFTWVKLGLGIGTRYV